MNTTNHRPTPEGAWDHEAPHHLESEIFVSADIRATKPRPLLALEVLDLQKEKLEMLKGWRTLLLNSAVAVVMVAQASGLVDVVPPQYVAPALAVLSFLNIWLRSMTDTAIGKKV